MASAQDDVRIESFRYKFTQVWDSRESEAAPWGDVTDLTTSEDGSEVYTKMEFHQHSLNQVTNMQLN